jgi:hypothetical protein
VAEPGLREGIALISSKPEQPRRLAGILRQPAAALLVESAERVLREGLALIRGEPEQARGLALIFRQPATAVLIVNCKSPLRVRIAFFGGELKNLAASLSFLGSPPRPYW